MDDRSMRATALEVASRSGLPPKLTLDAARDFYNFLAGKEPEPANWVVKELRNSLLAQAAAAKAPTKRKTPAKARKP